MFSSFDGKVLYASNFRDFGPILIIDHGDDFNTLMVGLDKIDVKTGQNLLKGEPVGVMKKLKLPEIQPGPRLYLELRRYGKPVNPLAWLSPKEMRPNQMHDYIYLYRATILEGKNWITRLILLSGFFALLPISQMRARHIASSTYLATFSSE